jgi:hypothetical protein
MEGIVQTITRCKVRIATLAALACDDTFLIIFD